MTSTPVVLSYGLGTDSTAILMRWLTDPSSRDFELSDLLVVTAMTGDEWPESGQLVTDHVLPLMRQHQVRYVQVARTTGSQTDGITVLSDTTNPTVLHLDGAYKLSDEMLAAGTVPQMGGVRKCSQKAKGFPLDRVIAQVLGAGTAFRHVIGFEANEPKRAVKDALSNTVQRTGEYPLIEWGWDRAACEDYIASLTGVLWLKSACVYCPFALSNKAGRIRALLQYRANVTAAVDALFLEHVSLALNPRQGLNGVDRLVDMVRTDGNIAALEALQERLEGTEHAVYEIRRVVRPTKNDPTKAANASRSVKRLATGTWLDMEAHLLGLPGEYDSSDGHHRKWVHRRGQALPAIEHMYVVAPAVVHDKTDPKFEGWFHRALLGQLVSPAPLSIGGNA